MTISSSDNPPLENKHNGVASASAERPSSAARLETPPLEGSLTLQASWMLLAKIFAFAMTIIFPLLLVRRLDQLQFGIYKQAFLVVNTALALAPLGVGMSAYYFLPREVERRAQTVFNILLFYGAISGAVLSLLWLNPRMLAAFFGNEQMAHYAPAIGLAVFFCTTSSFLEVVAIANREMRLAAVFIIVANSTKSLFMISAVLISGTVDGLLRAAIAQGVLQTVVLLIYLHSRFGKFWSSFDWSFMRLQLAYALPLGFGSLLLGAQTDLHNYFVSHRFGPVNYAVYSIGCFDLPLISLLSESIAAVTIPRISHLQKHGRPFEIISLLARMARKLSAIYFPLYVFLLVMAREVITFLFTAQYFDSWPIFAVNLTLIPLAIVMSVYDPVIRAYAAYRYYAVRVRVVVLVVLIAALWWATQRFGLMGAIVTVVSVAAMERFAMALKVKQILGVTRRDGPLLKDMVKLGAIACGAGIVTAIARSALQTAPIMARLALCGIVFSVVYLAGIAMSGILDEDERVLVRRQIHRITTLWTGAI